MVFPRVRGSRTMLLFVLAPFVLALFVLALFVLALFVVRAWIDLASDLANAYS